MFVLLSIVAATGAAPAEPGTIVITAERTAGRVLPPTVELGKQDLRERQPATVADAVDALNGVTVRTNSRGESVARIRGSEERQAALFLDGAPLAVPWDGRADLGTLPAGLIGSVRAIKGVAPIEFGTNSVAGAVELTTRTSHVHRLEAAARLGSLRFRDASAVGWVPVSTIDLTFGATLIERDAEALASRSALPFSQDSRSRRTNTDAQSFSLFGAAATTLGQAISGSHCFARKLKGALRRKVTATLPLTLRAIGVTPTSA